MINPSIRIEGGIFSPDILSQLEDLPGQRPGEFGLESGEKVKDEIARAWADAHDYWRIFQRKLETVREGSNATSETRNLWIVPLLGLLRYDLEYQPKGTELHGQIYAISHRATNRDGISVQIVGYNDPAGLDRKPATGRRMSAHALVQEFLNLHEQLYGLVTDGHVIRLLRDSSRLIKQSYLEFDLDRIFTEGLFADFAAMYRLLHATRMPATTESAAESLIERYHQDSLDAGSRIRDGLSKAVEKAILDFGNGFLKHEANQALRDAVSSGELSPTQYYQQLLRLIYRLLFLMVIEERDLLFAPDAPKSQRDIHGQFYSVTRLRRLAEERYLADPRHHDLWLALQSSFRLFEAYGLGEKLGIAPLAGDLFSDSAINLFDGCMLGNDVILGCLRALGLYRHPDTKQLIRVNYAALNVEEFGSVYEGLLEYEPAFSDDGRELRFVFRLGDERAATGSHYTPDDLVQPLIEHSLDHLIVEKLKDDNPEAALLDLRVADVACGSGHILLAAARRIATELAIVRTGEEQPSPPAFREALRDVIRNCIYGVDLNPLAVELCKVALWLEAHIPGQPLNFLDHHIKCGNAIVGYADRDAIDHGIPDEAFRTLPDDDKATAASLRKRNKSERKAKQSGQAILAPEVRAQLDAILKKWSTLSALPERTPAEIESKKQQFSAFAAGESAYLLKQIAAIPIAQFYLAKTPENLTKAITDEQFRRYEKGEQIPQGQGPATALAIANQKRFFHWFIEFPNVMERGGFDCILGNPPYLGGQALSGTYSHSFCKLMKWLYKPTGLSELVVYFLRRIHGLLRDGGFTSIITTNSIVDGDVRKDGLEQVVASGSDINMAIRGMKWPGTANLVVSLLALYKGQWDGQKMLGGRRVERINTFFEDAEELGEPVDVPANRDRVFQGSIFLGDGFLLTHAEADALCESDPRNAEVIMPIINGKELNNEPDQAPGRSIINFQNWPLERAQEYAEPYQRVLELVKPVRDRDKMRSRRENWWRFGALAAGLYKGIDNLPRCFAAAATTKHLSFSSMPTDIVFLNTTYVFTTDRWDLFTVVQSTLHEVWARKYSGSLKQDLRYSPSKCFDTFAFPAGLWQTADPKLADIGERYHEQRKALMQTLWLGLTKVYNLFHDPELTIELVDKVSKTDADVAADGHQRLMDLRQFHREMDFAVCNAYGWDDLDLEHGFHEVDYLPENDRVRYTISPVARREVLNRLLAENHARAAVEAAAVSAVAKPKRGRRKAVVTDTAADIALFAAMSYPVSDADKAICSAAPAAVEQSGGLNSMDHLDALLLATHPAWCSVFLPAADQKRVDTAEAKGPAALFVGDNDSIRWKDTRDHLEQRKALKVDHSSTAQPITAGADLAAVKASLPAGVDEVVALALEALVRVQALRQQSVAANEEQQRILSVFRREALEHGLAVA